MPTPTNLIDSLQQKYAALTAFTGKPADLWFGDVWPTRAGAFIGYPFVRFVHRGTPVPSDFEYTALEEWEFAFEVYAETAQAATTIFDRVRFNGSAPSAQAGFWYASSVDTPAGYTFLALAPSGAFTLDVRSGQFSPTGTPTHVLSFTLLLSVQRTA